MRGPRAINLINMPLQIVIPEDADLIRLALEDSDHLHHALISAEPRTVLFHGEKYTGYVLHTSEETDKPVPDTINLKVSLIPDLESDVHPSNTQTETQPKLPQVVHRGVSETSGQTQPITVWEFDSVVGSPHFGTSGRVVIAASFQTRPIEQELALLSIRERAKQSLESSTSLDLNLPAENLLEELNNGNAKPFKAPVTLPSSLVARKSRSSRIFSQRRVSDVLPEEPAPPACGVESARVYLSTCIPLHMKLRSTKAGGRSDQLLTTLQIEASEQMFAFAETNKNYDYSIRLLAVDVGFQFGTSTQLGNLRFPQLLALNEMLKVTYKLVSFDSVADKDPAAMSKPFNIKLTAQVERKDKLGGETILLGNKVSTSWAPILEFGASAPPLNSQLKSQLAQPLRSKKQLSKLPQFSITPAKKSVAINSVVSVNNVAALGSPYASGRSPFQKAASPSALRPLLPSISSPALPSQRGSAAKRKFSRNVAPFPDLPLNMTINLSNWSATLSGLRLTFGGPQCVTLRQAISWRVQAINNTGRVLRLSLLYSPTKHHVGGTHYAQYSNSSHSILSTEKKAPQPFQAMSRLQIYSKYMDLRSSVPGVIVLSNEVSMGVLDHNQVGEAEFEFVGVTKGVFNLDGLRICESQSGDVIEIGKLLEVFVK